LLAGFARIASADTQVGGTLPPPPDKLYGDLFVAVQTQQI
jgi:alpha,alpha-trehalase